MKSTTWARDPTSVSVDFCSCAETFQMDEHTWKFRKKSATISAYYQRAVLSKDKRGKRIKGHNIIKKGICLTIALLTVIIYCNAFYMVHVIGDRYAASGEKWSTLFNSVYYLAQVATLDG